MREGREPWVPRIQATDEVFFQRCRDLSRRFFREVFCRFIERVVGRVPPRFCGSVASLRERFTDVVAIDGSRVAAIAHTLKILRHERAVALRGCLLVVYDLRRVPYSLLSCIICFGVTSRALGSAPCRNVVNLRVR